MIYVVIQFSAIFFLIANAQLDNFNLISTVLLILSLLIGLIALANMKISNLNITPALKKDHQLVTVGIYTYIRHPMYTSVMLACLALLLTNTTLINQIVMLILIVDLFLKSNFEEKLLSKRFHHYKNYQKKTGRFLPFI
ncbi:MAG: NnrU family protein [Candidatus Thioglobus sp.]|uniref:methyltransferase family protein n=1 Tax=Candidatus Thioglobus sp. TaxID=2026721 RepID=UPI0026058001|nr:NnrU family protein [Candidatus Thioglobus sp.]MDC9726787.1 NnrU family protein [Candidatus Thioglobus sp.]